MNPIKLFASAVQLFLGLSAISKSLLVLPEKNIVFDLNVFSLGESELGDTQVVFQVSYFCLVSVDFPDIEFDIVTSGRICVKLALGVLRAFEFIALASRRTLSPRWTPRKIFTVCVFPLRH